MIVAVNMRYKIYISNIIQEVVMITSEEVKRRYGTELNELRGSMDSRYKDYMLGLMFYKF